MYASNQPSNRQLEDWSMASSFVGGVCRPYRLITYRRLLSDFAAEDRDLKTVVVRRIIEVFAASGTLSTPRTGICKTFEQYCFCKIPSRRRLLPELRRRFAVADGHTFRFEKICYELFCPLSCKPGKYAHFCARRLLDGIYNGIVSSCQVQLWTN